MRKILSFLVCLFFVLLLTVGFGSNKTKIAFSSAPFTKDGNNAIKTAFSTGERVYFGIYNPKGFKTRLIKVQIIKKESEKSEFWGYEYFYNRTAELDNKNYYTDYITFNNPAFYIFRIFEYTDLNEPLVSGIIKVE